MEEEKLKITEIDKTKKKVNKALIFKSLDMLFATGSAWLVCNSLNEFSENGRIFDLVYALSMLVCYVNLLKSSRKYTEVIADNLDTEIDLEELAEKEGLSK